MVQTAATAPQERRRAGAGAHLILTAVLRLMAGAQAPEMDGAQALRMVAAQGLRRMIVTQVPRAMVTKMVMMRVLFHPEEASHPEGLPSQLVTGRLRRELVPRHYSCVLLLF